MKECKNFKRYKGLQPPRCNNGDPCDACKKKFNQEEGIPIDVETANELIRLGVINKE